MIAVRWLGHSTAVLDVGGARLLTDPLLRGHLGLLRRTTPRPRPDQWRGADGVLLSHLHLDHADLPSLRMLPGTPVLTAPANAGWLSEHGVRAVAVSERWQELPLADGGLEVRLVRAEHHSRPMPHRPNAASGFLVRAGGEVVWFAGDTSAYPEMSQLPALAGGPITLVLLPIHGWGPRLSPGHMDAEQAAETCRVVGAQHVLPIHFGTFHPVGFNVASLAWMRRPLEQFVDALERHSPATSLVPPVVGRQATLP
ncbi:MAG: MBL fold metallo-hydrolase [Actinomycetes bacterium]